jgi:hypothetical protein
MESKAVFRAIPLEVLESSSDPCFAVSEALDITYCNPAWDAFALKNEGEPGVFRAQVVSRNLLEFVPADLKAFHAGLFAKARSTDQPVNHDYECSSATMFRLYRMQIYPLDQGFAVINSLRLEHPHDRTPLEPKDALYRSEGGLIRMCANCRRTNRTSDPAAWDWVPAYVDRERENVTHGVCPLCLEYYYRPYLQP